MTTEKKLRAWADVVSSGEIDLNALARVMRREADRLAQRRTTPDETKAELDQLASLRGRP